MIVLLRKKKDDTNKLKKIRFQLVLVGPFCFLLIFSELFAQVKHLMV